MRKLSINLNFYNLCAIIRSGSGNNNNKSNSNKSAAQKKLLSWRQTAASAATLAAPIYFTQLRVCAYRTPSETGRERVRKIGRYTKSTYIHFSMHKYICTCLCMSDHKQLTHTIANWWCEKNITMRQFRLKQRAATPLACKGRANCKKEGRMKQTEKWETQIQKQRVRRWDRGR